MISSHLLNISSLNWNIWWQNIFCHWINFFFAHFSDEFFFHLNPYHWWGKLSSLKYIWWRNISSQKIIKIKYYLVLVTKLVFLRTKNLTFGDETFRHQKWKIGDETVFRHQVLFVTTYRWRTWWQIFFVTDHFSDEILMFGDKINLSPKTFFVVVHDI